MATLMKNIISIAFGTLYSLNISCQSQCIFFREVWLKYKYVLPNSSEYLQYSLQKLST